MIALTGHLTAVILGDMGEYAFTVHIEAMPEVVFDLFTDLERMHEWVGGVTRITDVSGQRGQAGSSYTVWFGRMRSPTVVLEAERPHLYKSRFGHFVLRGEMEATFAPDRAGTTMTERFRTEGLIPAISARIFATGSWRGSFRGELETFASIAEREAAGGTSPSSPATSG